MKLDNLRIRTRLALMLAGVLLAMCGMGAAGMWGLHALFGITQQVLSQDVRLAQRAAEIQNLVLQERRFEKDAFINLGDPARLQTYVKKWQDTRSALAQAIDETGRLRLSDEDAQALRDIAGHLTVYAGGFEATLALVASGKITSTQDANADLGKVKAAVHGMDTASDAMGDRASARAAGALAQIDTVRSHAMAWQVGLAAAAVLLSGVLCWRVTVSITRPIAKAVEVAETVAAGDLTSSIDVRSTDETGQLLAALKRMNDSLVGIVRRVRDASDSIATGSTQIATGNIDLSQRTEEQASNLQQTAASMEQLTAAVKNNADTARAATQLAAGACNAAVKGGEVVGDVIRTMENIATSSRRIGDIIGVIDAIAFQTNILALNAAVEAARAGEQGRGFAVVASEVRNLAQRSAQAAKEIKGLIGDSVDKVEAGTAQVATAGSTMTDIVSQVRQVSELIAAISSASVEQSTGIGQVGDAVTQLDQVTQQNAALVEESAAAAESLQHQAAALLQTVSLFRVAEDTASAAA